MKYRNLKCPLASMVLAIALSVVVPAVPAQDFLTSLFPAIPGVSPVSGAAAKFIELTTPQATGPRAITQKDIARGFMLYDGGGGRWKVTNRYLPGDRNFLSMIYRAAAAPDGTLLVAAVSIVSASETGRPPRANRDWYADNGQGIWRVAPDGRVTAFSVRDVFVEVKTAVCNVSVAEAAFHLPDRWGGIAVAPSGDVYVSDYQLHMILRLRSDGYVEHVAGGGEKACEYDPWKDKKESGYRDGAGRQALFNDPRGLAVDRQGNLLVADWGNCALRRIDPAGNVTTLYKGCHVAPGDAKNPEKWINYAYVLIDPQGRPVVGGSVVVPARNIYSNIHRLHPDGRMEQLLSATKGYANSGKLRVEFLSGMVYLPNGTVLIADDSNNLLRTLSGSRLSDWFGKQGSKGDEDINGPASQARLRRPGWLSVAGNGTLFVAPASPRSSPVRKVDGKTREVSTWLY